MHQRILKELEKTSSKFWNISRETAEFLYVLARSVDSKNILEVGTSNGYSGIFLASACEKLYTVESHAERFELAQKNFMRAGLSEKIVQIKGHAPEVVEPLQVKFDLAFLDATKYEYGSYLETILPKIRKGGLVIADNIDSHRSGLGEFLKEIRTLKNVRSFYVPIGTGLLVLGSGNH